MAYRLLAIFISQEQPSNDFTTRLFGSYICLKIRLHGLASWFPCLMINRMGEITKLRKYRTDFIIINKNTINSLALCSFTPKPFVYRAPCFIGFTEPSLMEPDYNTPLSPSQKKTSNISPCISPTSYPAFWERFMIRKFNGCIYILPWS